MNSAEDYALYLLGLKDYSRKEIEDKLKRKEFDESVISSVCDKLEQYGYIDDERYAEHLIEKYSAKAGEKKIRWELTRRGIDRSIIEEKLDLLSEEDLQDSLYALFCKMYKGEETKQKVFRSLASKGYEFESIKKALDRYNEEHQ